MPLKNERNSNLELFRIITMVLIVAHHYVVNSGLLDAGGPILSDPLAPHSLFLLIFGAFGKTGINCFVLITGYFMCTSSITVRKFVKLFAEWCFYNIAIAAIFWITGYEQFTLKGVLHVLFPINELGTNFTACYMIFFLLIPFLNILVNKMSEKQHILLMLVLFFAYILLGTLHRITINYVSWFCVLYLIASYIRLYPKNIFESAKTAGIASLLSILLSVLSVVICSWLTAQYGLLNPYYFLQDANTLLAVTNAVTAFLFFKNIKMKKNNVINTVAASVFGVLCIHANSDAMRQWLWRDVLNNTGAYKSAFLYIIAIASVAAVYIACTLIDFLRIKLIEKPFLKAYDKVEEKFRERIYSKKQERSEENSQKSQPDGGNG